MSSNEHSSTMRSSSAISLEYSRIPILQSYLMFLPTWRRLGQTWCCRPHDVLFHVNEAGHSGPRDIRRSECLLLTSTRAFFPRTTFTCQAVPDISLLLSLTAFIVTLTYFSTIGTSQTHTSGKMYTQTVLLSVLAALATASPVQVRQIGGTRTTSKEFSEGGCRDILFAWARGSTEIGNMVCFQELDMCSVY